MIQYDILVAPLARGAAATRKTNTHTQLQARIVICTTYNN